MKREITIKENYFLILSDEKLNNKDWYLDTRFDTIQQHSPYEEFERFKKIAYHLPLKDSPILEGVPLLPMLKSESEYMADNYIDGLYNEGDINWERHRRHYKSGYDKSQEKYRFTEEDVKKAFDLGFEVGNDDATYRLGNGKKEFNGDEFYKFIESLQQPRHPNHFEFETEVNLDGKNALDTARMIEKTIITSLGHKVAVGKYLFD